jgi:hypothetical protein
MAKGRSVTKGGRSRAQQSGILGFEPAHAHKSQHTGVDTRTQNRKYGSQDTDL